MCTKLDLRPRARLVGGRILVGNSAVLATISANPNAQMFSADFGNPDFIFKAVQFDLLSASTAWNDIDRRGNGYLGSLSASLQNRLSLEKRWFYSAIPAPERPPSTVGQYI
jgi:hypothetical protein